MPCHAQVLLCVLALGLDRRSRINFLGAAKRVSSRPHFGLVQAPAKAQWLDAAACHPGEKERRRSEAALSDRQCDQSAGRRRLPRGFDLSVIGNRAHFRRNAQAKRGERRWTKMGRLRLRDSSHRRALPECPHQAELPSRLHAGVLLIEPGNLQVFLSLAEATVSGLRREYATASTSKGTLRRRSMGCPP